MKWFKHDSNANSDAKMKKLRQKYGMECYGLYWYCVEIIAGNLSSDNITFELEEDAATIASDWGMDTLKVQEMMAYMVSLGLFECLNDSRISCLKLAKRLDDTQSKNPEIKKIIAGFSDKLGETPNNSELLRTEEIRLDKIRLDKKNKDKENAKNKFSPPEPISPAKFSEYLSMRRSMRKQATDRAKVLVCNKIISTAEELGMSTDDVLDVMMMRNWLSVEPDWIRKVNGKTNPDSTCETKLERAQRLANE